MPSTPSPSEILSFAEHRPWPLPNGPWLMTQVWYDLMFAHWRVSGERLRALIPAQLALDTFAGEAWLAVTPFHMDVKVRATPLPAFHFPELNCRTYVSFGGKPGVFFFSLDATSRLAVWGARTLYKLPYFHSQMTVHNRGGEIGYSAERSGSKARFVAAYQPDAVVRRSQPGTLEHWLTERYCLYTCSRGHVYRGEIHHVPWPLQPARCDIRENEIAAAAGIELPDCAPVAHFASRIDVVIWPLRRADETV